MLVLAVRRPKSPFEPYGNLDGDEEMAPAVLVWAGSLANSPRHKSDESPCCCCCCCCGPADAVDVPAPPLSLPGATGDPEDAWKGVARPRRDSRRNVLGRLRLLMVMIIREAGREMTGCNCILSPTNENGVKRVSVGGFVTCFLRT